MKAIIPLVLWTLLQTTCFGVNDYHRATLFRAGNLVACFTLSRVLEPVNGVCALLLGGPPTAPLPEAYFWALGLVNRDFSQAVILDVAVGTSLFAVGLNTCFYGTATKGLSHDPRNRPARIDLPDNSVDLVVSYQVLANHINEWPLFEELVRVTKPAGKIVFNVPMLGFKLVDTNQLKDRLRALSGVGEVSVVSNLNPLNGYRITVKRAESKALDDGTGQAFVSGARPLYDRK